MFSLESTASVTVGGRQTSKRHHFDVHTSGVVLGQGPGADIIVFAAVK